MVVMVHHIINTEELFRILTKPVQSTNITIGELAICYVSYVDIWIN